MTLTEGGDVRIMSPNMPIMVEQLSKENIQKKIENDARPQRIQRRPIYHMKKGDKC